MKINKCNLWSRLTQNPFVNHKKLYTTKTMQTNAQMLLDKMNKSTQYAENKEKTTFTSNILASLRLDDGIKFTDERYFIRNIDKDVQPRSLCSLIMGKTTIQMDSKNGEILNLKKSSIFKSFNSIIKQAESALQKFNTNFDDKNVVEKSFLCIAGWTKKGFEELTSVKPKK